MPWSRAGGSHAPVYRAFAARARCRLVRCGSRVQAHASWLGSRILRARACCGLARVVGSHVMLRLRDDGSRAPMKRRSCATEPEPTMLGAASVARRVSCPLLPPGCLRGERPRPSTPHRPRCPLPAASREPRGCDARAIVGTPGSGSAAQGRQPAGHKAVARRRFSTARGARETMLNDRWKRGGAACGRASGTLAYGVRVITRLMSQPGGSLTCSGGTFPM